MVTNPFGFFGDFYMKNSLTVPEAAKELGVSHWAVYDLIRRGRIPPGVVYRVGRAIRVNHDALRQWIAGGGSYVEQKEGGRDVA